MSLVRAAFEDAVRILKGLRCLVGLAPATSPGKGCIPLVHRTRTSKTIQTN